MVVIDKIKSHRLDTNLDSKLQHEEIIEAAKKGTIWELKDVFKKFNITHAEMLNFFGSEYARYVVDIVKPETWYATTQLEDQTSYNRNSGYEPPVLHSDYKLGDGESKYLLKAMTSRMAKTVKEEESSSAKKASVANRAMSESQVSSGIKAMLKAEDPTPIDDAADVDEVEEPEAGDSIDMLAEEVLGDYDALMDNINDKIFENQLLLDADKDTEDIKREIGRLIALAKSGHADASILIVALAKYNVAKNGAIFTNIGKKMFAMNERMNMINATLYEGGGFDLANMEMVKNQTRDLNFQMQQLQMGMQDTVKNISSTMEFAANVIGMIHRTKKQIDSNMRVG